LGKGLLRTSTLFMLLEGPKHEHEILEKLTKKASGLWKPRVPASDIGGLVYSKTIKGYIN